MIDAAVAVPLPARERTLLELGIRGAANGIPDPLENWIRFDLRDHKPDGWWLANRCTFTGRPFLLNDYGELSQPQDTSTVGGAALCIAGGRLLAIVMPKSDDQRPIWLAMTCSQLRTGVPGGPSVSGHAAEIQLEAEAWSLELAQVSRLFRTAVKGELEERLQHGQERSLAESLADARRRPPATAVDQPPPNPPPLGQGYEWTHDGAPEGVFRLIRHGRPTAATSLVDRERSIDEQVRDLEAIDWVPRSYVAPILEATAARRRGNLWLPDLPEGRLGHPLFRIYLSLYLEERPAEHPLGRYLWPSLAAPRELSLDPGEEIVQTWEPSDIRLSRQEAGDTEGNGLTVDPTKLVDRRCYLTTTRLVALARRDRGSDASADGPPCWGAHFRHEWICEVGDAASTKLKRSLIRAKPTAVGTTHAVYARLPVPDGAFNDMSFEGAPAGFADLLAGTVATSGAARQQQVEATSVDEKMFATVQRRKIPIAGAVPYSLPATLTG
jgi:hypothetical protein